MTISRAFTAALWLSRLAAAVACSSAYDSYRAEPNSTAAAPGGPNVGAGDTHPNAESKISDQSLSNELCAATFAVCREFLESATPGNGITDQNYVFVDMNERGRANLEAFTTKWLDHAVCVSVSGQVIVRSPVRGIIRSGRVIARASSPSSAAEIARSVTEASLAPCGEVQQVVKGQ